MMRICLPNSFLWPTRYMVKVASLPSAFLPLGGEGTLSGSKFQIPYDLTYSNIYVYRVPAGKESASSTYHFQNQ